MVVTALSMKMSTLNRWIEAARKLPIPMLDSASGNVLSLNAEIQALMLAGFPNDYLFNPKAILHPFRHPYT